jgi:hypothetical protein
MYMPALRPAHTVPVGDNRLLQIRSRRFIDLVRLKNEYLPELGDIIELPNTDYEFRAYCTHEQWAAALVKASLDIDYVKFKEQSEKKYGDKKLHEVYNAMWSVVYSRLSTHKIFTRKRGKQATFQDPHRSRTRGTRGSGYAATYEHPDMFDDATLADLVPSAWESELPNVSRMPNGNIDHSYCDHANTKNARRRCRNRNGS